MAGQNVTQPLRPFVWRYGQVIREEIQSKRFQSVQGLDWDVGYGVPGGKYVSRTHVLDEFKNVSLPSLVRERMVVQPLVS